MVNIVSLSTKGSAPKKRVSLVNVLTSIVCSYCLRKSQNVRSQSVPESAYFLKREGLGSALKKRVFIGHSYSALPLIFPIFRFAGNFVCVMRVFFACLELT